MQKQTNVKTKKKLEKVKTDIQTNVQKSTTNVN